MANICKVKRSARRRRHMHVRHKAQGTSERPRLAVFRSARHIYAQVIDDTVGATLVSVSTRTPDVQSALAGKTGNREAAARVGEIIAERCLAAGIEKVVFDRGGFKYHGRVRALAEAARSKNLQF